MEVRPVNLTKVSVLIGGVPLGVLTKVFVVHSSLVLPVLPVSEVETGMAFNVITVEAEVETKVITEAVPNGLITADSST